MKNKSSLVLARFGSNGSPWFQEGLYSDYRQAIKVRRTLVSKRTKFQNLQIFDTPRFGRLLVLDGAVQTTQKDEFIYHEMLTHVAMLAHPHPQRVLIIGAGDGGVLREVLKHKIKRAVMVEIDGEVVSCARKHLRSICGCAFEDARSEVLIGDGALYVAQTRERFDVVLIDSPDPVGPAKVLFSKQFTKDVLNCLTPHGIVVRQSGSSVFQVQVMRQVSAVMGKIFPKTFVYLAAIPTYIGGFFTFCLGSRTVDPTRIRQALLEKRYDALKGRTGYYNPGIHIASFALPNFVKDNLPAAANRPNRGGGE